MTAATGALPARRASVSGKMAAVNVKVAATAVAVAGPGVPLVRRRSSRAASTTGGASAGNGRRPTAEQAAAVDPAVQRRRRACRVTVDISSCRYAIIRKCLRERDYRLVKKTAAESGGGGAALLPSKWDIWWSDRGDLLRDLPRLSPFQKVNHFPSMEEICRKDFLANNLNAIYKVLPSEFQFFPRTFLIPAESVELQAAMEKGPKNATYIVKPRTLCQGKGISLIQSFAKLPTNEPCVVQRYIDNPLLLDGLKFDLRIYVLVSSVCPLKIHIFRNGLARFCTTPFQKPTKKNLTKKRMHLTNYAINKKSKDFQQATTGHSDSQASKRSVASVLKQLDETGRCASADVWRQICDLVVKTLLCIEPKLQSSYKSYFGSNDAAEAQWGPKCFEILGFDVMLDTAGKAWLFEVNHAPSFAGDSPLDRDIKTALISSTLDIVGVTNEKKRQYVRQQRADWAKRLWVATQAAPLKLSSGEQGNNQVTSKTTTSSLPHPCPEERKGAGGPEGTGESEDGPEDTSESGSESHREESEGDNVTAEEEAKLEKMSLKNVLLRRNRVNPVAAGEQETSHFRNEFSLLYPDEVSLHPNAKDPHSGYVYEKVREAAQVNKSKLWV